jgi:hypothetical protein
VVALYQVVRGGRWKKSCDVGCVPSSSSFKLILPYCLTTVQCRSASDLGSHRAWVNWCLWASLVRVVPLYCWYPSWMHCILPLKKIVYPSWLSYAVLRLGARSRFQSRVLPRLFVAAFARCSTEFVGSCKICNLMPITEPTNYTKLSKKITSRSRQFSKLNLYNLVVRKIMKDFKPTRTPSKIVISLAVTITYYIKVCIIDTSEFKNSYYKPSSNRR